jgi:hypothetical protein
LTRNLKLVGEESLGSLEIDETTDTQVYRLERRGSDWKIQEPIHIPYVSVPAEIDRLRKSIESAPTQVSKEYRETVAPSVAVLERYR